MSKGLRISGMMVLLGTMSLAGCAHHHSRLGKGCEACGDQACCETSPCGNCDRCGHGGGLHAVGWRLCGWMWKKSNAIPDTLPLGSVVRAHDQVMQTNGEAADFIMYRHQFVGQTAELTSDGKDHIVEIAARMPGTPFPVLVEREPNNSDPELDALRRNLIAQILTDFGNQDAQQRTVVSMPYGPGYISTEAEQTYYRHILSGGNGLNNGGNNGGFGGNGGGGGFY